MSITVSSMDEMVAAVPHLLGFHPEESLVAVYISRDTATPMSHTLDLTARIDLARVTSEPQACGDLLASHVNDTTRVALIAYSTNDNLANTALNLMADRLPILSMRIIDATIASAHHEQASRITHQFEAIGADVVASRDALYATVNPPTDPQALGKGLAGLAKATRSIATWSDATQAKYLHTMLNGTQQLPTYGAALLATMANNPAVRDSFYTNLDGAHDAARKAHILTRAAHLLPDDPRVTHLLILGATASMVAGNGVMTNAFLDRVDHLEPGLAMTDTLRRIITSPGNPAQTFETMRAASTNRQDLPGITDLTEATRLNQPSHETIRPSRPPCRCDHLFELPVPAG